MSPIPTLGAALAVLVSLLASGVATADPLPDDIVVEAARLELLLTGAVRGHRAAGEFDLAACLQAEQVVGDAILRLLDKRRADLTSALRGSDAADRLHAELFLRGVVDLVGRSADHAARCYAEPRALAEGAAPAAPSHQVQRTVLHGNGTVVQVTYPAQFDEPDSFGPPRRTDRPDWLDPRRSFAWRPRS